MTNIDFIEIARQASIRIETDEKKVEIRHFVGFRDKSIWGILFFLGGGVLFLFLPFFKPMDISSKVISLIIGISFLILSIPTLFRQNLDRITITNNELRIRHNLKQTVIDVDRRLNVVMKTKTIKIKKYKSNGYNTYIFVSHYLEGLNKEISILRFSMESKDADNAIKLGNEITRLINERILDINL